MEEKRKDLLDQLDKLTDLGGDEEKYRDTIESTQSEMVLDFFKSRFTRIEKVLLDAD